jgi:hypothetical protein
MADDVDPMSLLCRRAQADAAPADALAAVVALRRRLEELETEHISAMLGDGASWSAVAGVLGITRQAAHRRFRHRAKPRSACPPRVEASGMPVTANGRSTVQLAREEADAQGSPLVGTEHLLLAVVRNAAGPMARALAAVGIDEDTLRARLQPTVVHTDPPYPEDRRRFTPNARAVLEGALRQATERGAASIGAEDLLLALLRNPAGGAAQTFDVLGVDPEAVFAGLGQRS